MRILLSDFTQSIEPPCFFEPGNRYASAEDEEESEFMDYHEEPEDDEPWRGA
jgi:hypothetical protein